MRTIRLPKLPKGEAWLKVRRVPEQHSEYRNGMFVQMRCIEYHINLMGLKFTIKSRKKRAR